MAEQQREVLEDSFRSKLNEREKKMYKTSKKWTRKEFSAYVVRSKCEKEKCKKRDAECNLFLLQSVAEYYQSEVEDAFMIGTGRKKRRGLFPNIRNSQRELLKTGRRTFMEHHFNRLAKKPANCTQCTFDNYYQIYERSQKRFGCVLLTEDLAKVLVIIARSHENNRPLGTKYSFPKGRSKNVYPAGCVKWKPRLDEDDREKGIDTALRELREETGIVEMNILPRLKYPGIRAKYVTVDESWHECCLFVIIVTEDSDQYIRPSIDTPQYHEVDDAKWMDISYLTSNDLGTVFCTVKHRRVEWGLSSLFMHSWPAIQNCIGLYRRLTENFTPNNLPDLPRYGNQEQQHRSPVNTPPDINVNWPVGRFGDRVGDRVGDRGAKPILGGNGPAYDRTPGRGNHSCMDQNDRKRSNSVYVPPYRRPRPYRDSSDLDSSDLDSSDHGNVYIPPYRRKNFGQDNSSSRGSQNNRGNSSRGRDLQRGGGFGQNNRGNNTRGRDLQRGGFRGGQSQRRPSEDDNDIQTHRYPHCDNQEGFQMNLSFNSSDEDIQCNSSLYRSNSCVQLYGSYADIESPSRQQWNDIDANGSVFYIESNDITSPSNNICERGRSHSGSIATPEHNNGHGNERSHSSSRISPQQYNSRELEDMHSRRGRSLEPYNIHEHARSRSRDISSPAQYSRDENNRRHSTDRRTSEQYDRHEHARCHSSNRRV